MEEVTLQDSTPLCRVCFNFGEYDIASYQVRIEETKYDLKEIFSELSTLETWQNENCPSKVCAQCAEDLGQCYLFLQKLRSADDKIRKLFTNDDTENDDESEGETFEMLECLSKDQEDDPEETEKQLESEEETEEATPQDCNDKFSIVSSELITKPLRRKIPKKYPHFVLTDKVTNILSNVQRSSSEEPEEEEADVEPPVKIKKLEKVNIRHSKEQNSYTITKFVPAQPTMVQDVLESNREELLVDQGPVNQIRMLDMAAVEVKSFGKIDFKDDDEESNIENPNTMYMCQYCPRAFSTSHHLIMHQRKSHVCQFCMKAFTKVTDLYKHSREAHNQFNCAICKKDFSSNSNLRQHMKKIHNVELPAHVSLLSYTNIDTVETKK